MSDVSRQQLPLWDRRYSPAIPGQPVEVTTSAELRHRLGDDLLQRPGRVFFHVVVICRRGDGLHEVDFAPVVLQPRRVVHVRPGQVHRWLLARSYQADLVLFPDTAGFPAAGWPVGLRWFDLEDIEWMQTKTVLRLMRREIELERTPERRNRSLSGALEMLIVSLGLDLPRHQDTAGLPKPYVDLVNQIEDDADWSRSVTERAQRLGYSQRTLTRACLNVTGHTAKEVLDDRILLEAQRLLVDGEPPVAAVARQLGFSEPGNFTKFFNRLSGESPAQWRHRNRPQGSVSASPTLRDHRST